MLFELVRICFDLGMNAGRDQGAEGHGNPVFESTVWGS